MDDFDSAYPNLAAILCGTVSGHYTEWPMVRTELSDLCAKLAAAERELQRWREITARRDPDDCAEGIRDLYDNWQTQRTRAETAERALAEMRRERDEWKANLAAELDGAGEMRRQHGARDNESFPAFVARLAAERDAAMLVVAAAHAWQGEPSAEGGLTHCESNLVRALGNFATWQRAAIAAAIQSAKGA